MAWNKAEKPEHAALQLLHTVLSVPQVSTNLTNMSAGQQKMLTFLLKQWRELNETLTCGKAFNYGPDAYYSWSEVLLKNLTVIVAYQPTVLTPQAINKSTLIVNGTHQDNLVLDFLKDYGIRNVRVYNCSGLLLGNEKLILKGLVQLKVPGAGIIRID